MPSENLDKLRILVNFVSPTIYEYISECGTYESAISTLKEIYIKPTNEVFARHLLTIRKQQSGETLDEFLQALKTLSKDCNFKDVNAAKYKEEYIRDSFITGIQSSSIRQRLLENNTLDLQAMSDQARALDMAHKSMESYNSPVTSSELSINSISSKSLAKTSTENVSSDQSKKCWNCGNESHPRIKCPAKDVNCHNCGRKGHFSKVCRSAKQQNTSSSSQTQTAAAIHFPTIA